MKLNRWEVDALYNLVTQEAGRVSAERRDLIRRNDDSIDLRRRLQRLQLLRVKLDKLRKRADLQKEREQ